MTKSFLKAAKWYGRFNEKHPVLGCATSVFIIAALFYYPISFIPIDPELLETKTDPFFELPEDIIDIYNANKSIRELIPVVYNGNCFLANPPQRNGYVLGDEASFINVPCTDEHMQKA
jgi:hypothetical protein